MIVARFGITIRLVVIPMTHNIRYNKDNFFERNDEI